MKSVAKIPDEIMYVEQMRRKKYFILDEDSIRMTKIREDWGFRSSFFDMFPDGDSILIWGKGYGHGIGMSQQGAMKIEGLPRGLVVVAVVHPARDRRIVVPQNRVFGQGPNLVATLLRLRTVAHRVANADQAVDFLFVETFEHCLEGVEVSVRIAEDPVSH